MAISAQLEQQIRDILLSNLLDEEDLENEEPWGEDGAMHAFSRGEKYGAHDLAEEILTLLNK